MTVPAWYPLILLALAAYRTYRVAATDTILDTPRARLSERQLEFVQCPWCLGFWIAVAWWGAYEITPHWTLVVAVPFAVAAVAALLWALLYLTKMSAQHSATKYKQKS